MTSLKFLAAALALTTAPAAFAADACCKEGAACCEKHGQPDAADCCREHKGGHEGHDAKPTAPLK
jgi:hypothetical protein